MKLSDLKATIAAYLGKTSADLTINGVDLGLLAMNQVRTQAELLHDFEFNRQLCQVAVDGVTGGSLENATLMDGSTTVSVKTVLDVGLLDDVGNVVGVPWTTTADSLNNERRENSRWVPRYPTDGEALSTVGGQSRFVFSGRGVNLFPISQENDYTLVVEAYAFTKDWTNTNLSDTTGLVGVPWNTYGAQYVQWASIVHLNNIFKEFVFRQEGNVSPPDKMADAALQTLIEWDIFKFEQFRRHGR